MPLCLVSYLPFSVLQCLHNVFLEHLDTLRAAVNSVAVQSATPLSPSATPSMPGTLGERVWEFEALVQVCQRR